MKRTVTFYLAMALILIGVFAFKKYEENQLKMTGTEQQWNSRYTVVAVSKAQLLKSNLPINEIKPLVDSLDKFLNEMSTQLIPQMKPPVADSTKKKK